jgi:tRNA(fMet)-specific endonuclease VapC
MPCMLDTDICIYLIKRKPIHVLERLRTLRPGEVAVSSITVAELQYGACKSSRPERNQEALAEFFLPLEVVSFDESAAAHYGEIRTYLGRKGDIIGAMDLLIAAHARSLSLTLVTNNIQEFQRIPGLHTENWV